MSSESTTSSTNENERVQALRRYDILDTPEEVEFNNIVKLAALVCNMPSALISLVDEDRVFVKSVVGGTARIEPRDISFSQYTILGDDVMEVKDTLLDERFATHPRVIGNPHVRFYAGAPLIDQEGFKLGVIGVYDTKPGALTEPQKEGLRTLAQEIITHLSLRKKSADLQAKTNRFEELLNLSTVSPEVHCILDSTGTILFINDAVTTTLEYTAAEATGLSMWSFCYKEDQERLIAFLENGLRNKLKEFSVEFRIVSKTGIVRWLSWSMVVKAGRWYTYGRDITESKHIESELVKLSFVASKIDNAVVISDADNHVSWVNAAFEKITGFTLEDLKGKRLGDLIVGPKTDMELLAKARERIRLHQSFTVDLLSYRKDQTPIWLSIYNTVVLNDDGEVDMEVEIIIDITDKKKAEEEALQLSEAKEMFLSVMSHEIRTPLNAVIGMTHLLLDNDPKVSQIDDLNILKFSAENLLNIINDILDFSKIETGNLMLERVPVDIKSLATDIISSLQVNAANKDNKLSLTTHGVPALVLGDKTRLYQILMNLLGNAIKFTGHGQVTLNLELVKEEEHSFEILFQVIDNGIGIPEDKLSYIFEAFTQAKTDISRKYGGTGLGLAITKKLLKLFQSEILVESTEGRGTTFSFSIVFNKVSSDSNAIQSSDLDASFVGKSILVVDDNDINILIASRILSKMGFVLEFANNGHEAIEKVMAQQFDLIFMDIKMPGIDGYETTSIIRELPGEYYKSVPIIALTASTLQNEHFNFKASGMDGHVLKPFKPEEIKAMIHEQLSR